jgi:hypothetical protein
LEDLESKFGTLIQIQKPIRINPYTLGKKSIKIQISRTFFTIDLVRDAIERVEKKSLFCCCFGKK